MQNERTDFFKYYDIIKKYYEFSFSGTTNPAITKKWEKILPAELMKNIFSDINIYKKHIKYNGKTIWLNKKLLYSITEENKEKKFNFDGTIYSNHPIDNIPLEPSIIIRSARTNLYLPKIFISKLIIYYLLFTICIGFFMMALFNDWGDFRGFVYFVCGVGGLISLIISFFLTIGFIVQCIKVPLYKDVNNRILKQLYSEYILMKEKDDSIIRYKEKEKTYNDLKYEVEYNNIVPKNYKNSYDIERLANIFKSGRAATVKEAINIDCQDRQRNAKYNRVASLVATSMLISNSLEEEKLKILHEQEEILREIKNKLKD